MAYRPVTVRKGPQVEAWPEPLPALPLWLTLDYCLPAPLDEGYVAACRSLRISA